MTSGPTLGDVAHEAGVSKATASKVFNARSDVSQETAARVRAVAEELGYRSPVRKPPGGRVSVWVAFDTVATYYTPKLLSGLLIEAADSDAVAVVSQTYDTRVRRDPPGSPRWMTEAHRSGAQAFVFVTSAVTAAIHSTATKLDTPLVVVDPTTRPPAGVTTVGATNFRGGVDAVEHLIGLGHTRIGFIGANLDSLPGTDRLAGYIDALRRADIEHDPALVLPGRFNADDGRAAVALLARADRPTAVFAANDAVAFGVYEACRQLRLRVPEDLSVIGFDDALGADVASPHLTTIRQPLVEMGRLALRICVASVSTGEHTSPPVELTTTLIERDSTCAAPVARPT